MIGRQMNDGIVDTAAAKPNMGQKQPARLVIIRVRKQIQRQRRWMLLDDAQSVRIMTEGQKGEQGASATRCMAP